MKGIELAKRFYMEYGRPMIRDKFPNFEARIAVGLVGEGSECFGFDDAISNDHDFGPSFCVWLTDEDYQTIGMELASLYAALPTEYMGYSRTTTPEGDGRKGAHRIGAFYKRFIGLEAAPQRLREWMYIPEEYLAAVTNGEIFRDDWGEFTEIRSDLLNYYPEDVRIRKIVSRAVAMAQSGQYNYSRCMRRGELVAARLAVDEFIRTSISMMYLLNRQYKPFYKWMHKGIEGFSVLYEAKAAIQELSVLPMQRDVWQRSDPNFWRDKLNTDDQIVVMIESICNMVINELKKQGLTDSDDSFLENHKVSILSKIKDNVIRGM